MNRFNDIEDFTTDQLRVEIRRRETADLEGRCWYCNQNLAAHTCKYAKPSPVPAWEFEPPSYIEGEDCMGRPEQYWRVWAKNPVTGKYLCGYGGTGEEASTKCIENVKAFLDKTQTAKVTS